MLSDGRAGRGESASRFRSATLKTRRVSFQATRQCECHSGGEGGSRSRRQSECNSGDEKTLSIPGMPWACVGNAY